MTNKINSNKVEELAKMNADLLRLQEVRERLRSEEGDFVTLHLPGRASTTSPLSFQGDPIPRIGINALLPLLDATVADLEEDMDALVESLISKTLVEEKGNG